MMNAELDAIHGSGVDEFRMEVLMREMEDMVVENKLKGEMGPMRSAWDKAVERQDRRGRARSL